ncbi:MAG: DUF2905 domain-containing protein [Bacteriovoracales bacterium]|nr:DUF2905 domain-containing protein [Bacteriovoracales bacterium]
MGKILMMLGALLFLVGLFWHFAGDRIPLGRLPGDIHIEGERGGFYFPITTCLLLSIVLSLLGVFFRSCLKD